MLLRIAFAVLIYAAAALETSAPQFPGFAPLHWLSLAAIGVVWRFSSGEAALWGALIGLTLDAVSGGRMGAGVLVGSTLVCALAAVRSRCECRSLLSLSLLAVATVCGFALMPIAVDAVSGNLEEIRGALSAAGGSALETGIAALLACAAVRALRNFSNQLLSPARA